LIICEVKTTEDLSTFFMKQTKNVGFLSGMAPLNKTALCLFIIAKFSGLVGVSLGFLGHEYHTVGGTMLGIAFAAIFSAVGCGLVQTSRDKEVFSREDDNNKKIRDMSEMMLRLHDDINALEARRDALKNLMIRRG